MRRHHLKPTDVLLVGLPCHSESGPPQLLLDVWCPSCKRLHNHGWGTEKSDEVHHRTAHCDAESPLKQGGYYIGVDPGRKDEYKAVVAEHRIRRARWEARQAEKANRLETATTS